jgi:hypothetical protein
MVPVSTAVALMIIVILLTIYSLLRFEEIYTAMISSIVGAIVAFSIAYCFLYGLVQGESYPVVQYTMVGAGYLFLIWGLLLGVLLFLLFLYRGAMDEVEHITEVQG